MLLSHNISVVKGFSVSVLQGVKKTCYHCYMIYAYIFSSVMFSM